jgi:hypothetical protein
MRHSLLAARSSITFHNVIQQRLILVVGIGLSLAMVGCVQQPNSGGSGSPEKIGVANETSGQSVNVGSPFVPLAAMVEDSSGNAVSGVTVTFTAPSSGPSGTFANGTATENDTTQSNGIATSTKFTANSIAGGPYQVMATVSGVSSPAAFILVNMAVDTISATAGTPQTTAVNTTFENNLQVTVMNGGNGAQGVTVTFTAPSSGASGTFAGGVSTTLTDENGVATAPPFTANGTAGTYMVVASIPGATTNFTLTNVTTSSALAAGNYVFSLSGTNSASTTGSPYSVAGVFTVNSVGVITGGEQSYSDSGYFGSAQPIASGYVVNSNYPNDGNLLITLLTGDRNIGVGGNGIEVLDANMISTTQGLITEFDEWATARGELDQQTITLQAGVNPLCTTASPTNPCGYAFFMSGQDFSAAPLAFGGVLTVDGANGSISGTNSVFDLNDDGSGGQYPAEAFSQSTISAPFDTLGHVVLDLNSSFSLMVGSNTAGVLVDGYLIDTNHIRLIENWNDDNLKGHIAGLALGQTGTGSFGSSSLAGLSYVVGLDGISKNEAGAMDVAGVLSASSTTTNLTGTVNYNNLSPGAQNPQSPITILPGTYAVQSNGRATLTVNVTGSISFTLELYLTGDGNALGITMDSTDTLAGRGFQQTSGASFTTGGFYSMGARGAVGQKTSQTELDSVGSFVVNGNGIFGGNADLNWILNSDPLIQNQAVSGTFTPDATGSSGVFTGTITGLGGVSTTSPSVFTYYLVDDTRVVAIETDATQLTLGFFELQP